jgi:hypothetical protein
VEPKIGLIFVKMIEWLWKKRLGEGEGAICEEEGKNVHAIMINIKFIV